MLSRADGDSIVTLSFTPSKLVAWLILPMARVGPFVSVPWLPLPERSYALVSDIALPSNGQYPTRPEIKPSVVGGLLMTAPAWASLLVKKTRTGTRGKIVMIFLFMCSLSYKV